MVAIGRPAAFIDVLVYAVIKATSAELRATCYLGATDPDSETQAIHLELTKTAKAYRDSPR